MNILEEIILHKKQEIQSRKELYPVKLLEQSIYFDTPAVSLKEYLQRPDKIGVIAEIKRRSPSKGDINPYIDVEQLSIGYMQAGASALSVLTDNKFFRGANEDLQTARKFNYCPILRKDFIIDEYQVLEAKSIGADAILLIAACLAPQQARKLAELALDLGMETLLEVHGEEELDSHMDETFDAIGVNNRDLRTFEVSIATSRRLARLIPDSFTRVSESGISSVDAVNKLASEGYHGFLIGEYFMRNAHPHLACADFIHKVGSSRRPKAAGI